MEAHPPSSACIEVLHHINRNQSLLQIDEELKKYGIKFITNSERAAAKKFGITKFPALVFFKNNEPSVYEGVYERPAERWSSNRNVEVLILEILFSYV